MRRCGVLQSQLFALHEENEALQRRLEELRLTLQQARHVNALDGALDAQVSDLWSLVCLVSACWSNVRCSADKSVVEAQ